jgi:5-methylcytosine-specific restriction protein B
MATTKHDSTGFLWVPFFEELATKLAAFENRQKELIAFLEQLRVAGHTITQLTDHDANGKSFLIEEIDPFTFMAVVNRGLTPEKRFKILEAMKGFFGLTGTVPKDYTGVPVMNNQNSWFMSWQRDRKSSDVPRLWRVFLLALESDPFSDASFQQAFDEALDVRNVNFNLTMGLFWFRPRRFLSLDSNIRKYLKLAIPSSGLSYQYYGPLVAQISALHPEGFPELSHSAWVASNAPVAAGVYPTPAAAATAVHEVPRGKEGIGYWMVGAWWSDREPQDQTQRFRDEGIWENGFTDRLLDEVKSMKPGDRIAIKSAGTQKLGLPFDYRGQTASRILIKATGTILKNRNDGRVVEVDWDPPAPERPWFFYTHRGTVWHLDSSDELARRLIRFAFEGESQDYDHFLRLWEEFGLLATQPTPALPTTALPAAIPYSVDDILAEGVFIPRQQIEGMLRRLQAKKNLVLDGAPGVGKTFLARKLAYALMEERDATRIMSVQFHPSYAYEDFVRGYRPSGTQGTLALQDGPLLEACKKAALSPDLPHVLLIDEVNRGNTSQIFGELLALIEADKRGYAHAVTPIYRRHADETLAIPENLFVIGTMNLADRSLALVDYALRRRFAFFTLEPQFSSPAFFEWHATRQMPDALLQRIRTKMETLNEMIASDSQLGPNFRVGHSFFCPRGDNLAQLGDQWYRDVVTTEIVPLLREYWFDAKEKVAQAVAQLLEA